MAGREGKCGGAMEGGGERGRQRGRGGANFERLSRRAIDGVFKQQLRDIRQHNDNS